MAENENCFNCVYSYWDPTQIVSALSGGFGVRPSCANHPDAPGRMQPLSSGRICRNYRPRTAAPEGDVKQIPLGDGLFAYVDAADFEWLNQWTWHLSGGYAMRYHRGKVIYMHREIVQPPAGMIVDHLNRNKLDNTRANLRACTHQENSLNRDKRRDSASRFRGVSRRRDRNGWCVRVRVEGRRIWLGSFADEMEAARAHDRTAVEHLGDAACLNFPEEWPPQRRQQVHSQHAANEPVGATHASGSQTQTSAFGDPSPSPRKAKSAEAKQSVGANHHSPAPRKGRNAGARKRKTGGTKKAKQARRKTRSSRATGHRPRTTAAKQKK